MMQLPWVALSRCLKSRLRRGKAECLNFGEERFEGDRITEVMGIGIIERVEDIEIQSAHRIRGHDRRLGAGGNNAFQEVARCQVSQLYTSSRRPLWVTRASHSR